LTATIIMIVILSLTDISYKQYTSAKEWMTYMLGPATIALAVPMYKNRKIIKEKLMPAALALFIGTISTITSAVWLSKALGLSKTIQATSAVKAVTTPVAIEAVVIIHGNPSLAAAFVITAGIFGAVLGPMILNVMKISRGLGIGTVSHGIGTSQAVVEGPIQGAVSSVAMGLAAIITSIILPWVYPIIHF
jgi:putative effector of murein hydrolase